MKISILALPIFLAMVVPSAFDAQAASFDCTKASTNVEILICKTPSLSRSDEELSAIYKQAVAVAINPDAVKQEQRNWIARMRNKCSNAQCLAVAYATRRLVLAASLTQDAASRPPAGQLLLVRAAQAEQQVGPGRTFPVSLVGRVEFGHDAAGGRYDLVNGNARITLSYVWELSDADQDKLAMLQERKSRVRAVGMLMVYANDGSAGFAGGAPLGIYAD